MKRRYIVSDQYMTPFEKKHLELYADYFDHDRTELNGGQFFAILVAIGLVAVCAAACIFKAASFL